MPRLMSVSLTEDAVRERRKTVTRRLGWTFLKPGDRLTLCRKVMGRKPGEPLIRLADVEVIDVRRESLAKLLTADGSTSPYGAAEMAAEGFPGLHPASFIYRYFEKAQGVPRTADVTRIEWRYLEVVSPGEPH